MLRILIAMALLQVGGFTLSASTYPIVDTGVETFYSNSAITAAPAPGQPFYGQDATYEGAQPSYANNGDGTTTDNVTGLMWQRDMGVKLSYYDAMAKADTLSLGGYTDWRVPTIKELYSLIKFTGQSSGENSTIKYIDTDFFDQPLGDPRPIDAQTWSVTKYTSTTMQADSTVFGVNFLDGRIKGYPLYQPGTNSTQLNTMYFRMVRGNPAYGINDFVDNADGTITDNSTGLMWQQADDGLGRDWQNALSYAESLSLAGYSDWRLPNAKELHSIVDYTRCPDFTNSAAINAMFQTTMINDTEGNPGQYPYFWTSTNHLDGPNPFYRAVYIAFGEAQGQMNNVLRDVHGAGAQRSDPKTGSPSSYPQYQGPQGDVLYVFNYARCVRDVSPSSSSDDLIPIPKFSVYPNPFKDICSIDLGKSYAEAILTIYNLRGALLKQIDAGHTAQIKLDLGDLSAGLYFFKVTTPQGATSGKFIKI